MSNTESPVGFGLAREQYRRFRPTYPRTLYDRIMHVVPSNEREFAVDIGAGTGLSTTPLCKHFRRVLAVEPDGRMAAEIPRHPNLTVVSDNAESVALSAATVDLLTCGTAFYWMDGPLVLDRVFTWLKKRGVIAIYRYGLPAVPAVIRDIVDHEFDQHWEEFRHPRLLDEEYSWRSVISSRFRNPKRLELPNQFTMTPEQLLGFFQSTSYMSAYIRTLVDPTEYIADLREKFTNAQSVPEISVGFPIELIIAHKVP